MRFFLDTANIDEIKTYSTAGLIDGVTTNPSIIAKSGQDIFETLKTITKIVRGSVSAEVISQDHKTQMKEAEKLLKIAGNITIKVPLTPVGLLTCKELSQQGASVNVTLCFTAAQALLAAKAGAAYVSPFIGRLDDVGQSGIGLIQEIADIYRNYPDIHTNILAASIRNVDHVVGAAKAGAEIATVPPKILQEMFRHPLTDKGVELFELDWKKSKQSIL